LPAAKRAALVLVLALAVTAGVSAHRRDEYLQAARLTVEPARVAFELDMTPGISVAETIIAAIDRDRDDRFSAGEQRAYVDEVTSALRMNLDGQRLPFEVTASSFADPGALRRGEGTIRLEASGALPRLAAGSHRLVFLNGYRRDVSVYLANALVPMSQRVAIAGQARDADQRELTIDYDLRADAADVPPFWMLGLVAGFAIVAVFVLRPSRAMPLRSAGTPYTDRCS